MARKNKEGFFYLRCVKCGMFRRDVKVDLEFKHTKALLKKYAVNSVEELKKVYLCRKCKKQKPETIKKVPQTEPEGRVNTEKIAEDNILSYLIPKNENGYIHRKIGNKTDLAIVSEAFKHNVGNYNNPNSKFKNIMIVGETGSGKTHFARFLAFKLGLPYKRLNLNGATTVEDLVGQIVPTEKGFQWVDGWLSKFMRFGGLLVLDEINMAQSDILALLNSVLDDERTLTLTQKDGEVIKAHKHFFVISTMNLNYEGTKPLNEALKDRFSDVFIFDYERKIEDKLISDSKILDFAEKLRFAFNSGEIITPISTRSLMFFDNNIKLYGQSVAQELFFNRFEKAEKKVVEELWKTIYGVKNGD